MEEKKEIWRAQNLFEIHKALFFHIRSLTIVRTIVGRSFSLKRVTVRPANVRTIVLLLLLYQEMQLKEQGILPCKWALACSRLIRKCRQ